MSLNCDGTRYMSRSATLPTGSFTFQGWLKATAFSGYQVLVRTQGDAADFVEMAQTATTEFNTVVGDNSGEDTDNHGSTFVAVWVAFAIVWDDPTDTLTTFLRKEGESTWTAAANRSGTFNSACTLLRVFESTGLGDQAQANCRVTLLAVFSEARNQSQTLAQSASTTIVDSTNLYSFCSCATGTTIGQDTSGNGRDWTTSGAGLTLNSDEPSIALPAVARRRLLLGVGF